MYKFMRFAIAAAAMLSVTAAPAAEIHVLSGGAAKSAVLPLTKLFSTESGHNVVIDFATVGSIQAKLKEGARPDVVVMTSGAIAALEMEGKLLAGTATNLGSTGIGVAVREGAPFPDVSTPAALRETLLRAKSVAYIDPAFGGTSGIHFQGVLKKLGIEDEIRPKAVLIKGGYAAEAVARGEAEIVVHQMSEIYPVKGVRIVGPLPAELQLVTTYTAAVLQGTQNEAVARRFVQFMAGPAGRAGVAAAGLDPPR